MSIEAEKKAEEKGSILIATRELEKAFGANKVLKGISFEVRKGEVLAVIGPSGSGKSTLLRCITHLESLDAGSIRIDRNWMVKDGVYASKETLRLLCLRIGLVFQNFNLFPHLSVMENLCLAQITALISFALYYEQGYVPDMRFYSKHHHLKNQLRILFP